jgi:hypothetical protein
VKRTAIILGGLTLAAMGLVATTLSQAGRSLAPKPAAWATLAFARSEAAGGGVYLAGRRRVLRFKRGAVDPAWSPDGRRLAFVAPGAGGAGDVFVADADGTHRGRITRTDRIAERSPSWAPDGRHLVVERGGRLVVLRADGGAERRLAFGLEPAWSPGGRRIAFTDGDNLFLVAAGGGRPRQVTFATGAQTAPAWSPDGRRLVFVSDETGALDIHVVDLRSGAVTPLTADPAVDGTPAFSSDGHRIVFVSDRSGTEALWRVPARGGVPSPVGGPAFPADPQPRPAPEVVELLPDYDQQPPRDLDVRTSGGRHRLWFTSAADNLGLGPFIVNGRRPGPGRAMKANQRVRRLNGRLRTYPEIGIWRYNASSDHSHWHLRDFQRYELTRPNGSVIVRDRKSGFCIGDRYGVASGQVDGRIRRPVYRGFCNLYQPRALQVDGGTSVGYSDRYHSHLDGQNVDITRVPAGEYVLVNRANPQLLIRELRYDNNAGSVRIRIARRKRKSGSPSVRVLRTCPDSDGCSR